MEKTKSKSAKSKKHKSKIKGNKKGKKGKSKREKKMGKQWTCPFAFFCIYFAFSICVFFAFILHLCCFLPWKKNKIKTKNKSKSKKQNKCKQNANGQVHCFPIFSFFCTIYFASVFFRFEVLLFDFPCVFFFLHFFKSLKIIRISYQLWRRT